MKHEKFLYMAIAEARKGMEARNGGPFGAVVVLEGKVIGRGHNRVLADQDPTAHAEISAIRDACRKLEQHHLSGAVLYTNFEPCPMCLAAAYWADIRKLYFCSDRSRALEAGFMDKHLYEEIAMEVHQREMKSSQIDMEEMEALLDEWDKLDNKTLY